MLTVTYNTTESTILPIQFVNKLNVKVYNQKILIADSEIEVNRVLTIQFTNLGYKVFSVNNGKDALTFFTGKHLDLIIIDIILSKLDGFEVCRKIREDSRIPIIFLTPLNNVSDCIKALELGADDYIIKPFSPTELQARVQSLLRRSNVSNQSLSNNENKVLQIGDRIIDLETNTVKKNNSEISLTSIESSILKFLIANAGDKLTRTTILNNVWGYTPERISDTRIVDVHISRLRSKIEENPRNPDIIITVRGIGYMLKK